MKSIRYLSSAQSTPSPPLLRPPPPPPPPPPPSTNIRSEKPINPQPSPVFRFAPKQNPEPSNRLPTQFAPFLASSLQQAQKHPMERSSSRMSAKGLPPSPSPRSKTPSRMAMYSNSPRPPSARGFVADINVGDLVYIPAGRRGVVLFVGKVHGKSGEFAGIDLLGEDAAFGKNDGSVEGVRYFSASHPSSGIFVPIAKVSHNKPALDSCPPTPNTPRSRSVLGRPSSVLDHHTMSPMAAPNLKTAAGHTPARRTSMAQIPTTAPRSASRTSMTRPAATPTTTRTVASDRARATTPSAAIRRKSAVPSVPSLPSSTPKTVNRRQTTATHAAPGSIFATDDSDVRSDGSAPNDEAIASLKAELESSASKLADRDAEIQRQNEALQDLQNALAEYTLLSDSLQMSKPAGDESSRNSAGDTEDGDATKRELDLRELLLDKENKLTQLQSELDAKRSEFRQTLETLEQANMATNQMYELQIEELSSKIQAADGVVNDIAPLEALISELEADLERSRSVESQVLEKLSNAEAQNKEKDQLITNLKKQTAAMAEGATSNTAPLEEMITELETNLKQAKATEAQLRSQLNEYEAKIDQERKTIMDLETEKALAANDISFYTKPLETKISELEQKLQENVASENRVREKFVEVEAEIKEKDRIIVNLQRQIDALCSATAGEDQEQLVSAKKRQEKLEKEISSLEHIVESKVFHEQELERELSSLREQLSSATDDVASGRSQVEKLQQQLQDAASHPSAKSPLKPASSVSLNGGSIRSTAAAGQNGSSNGLWCEICETEGHDIIDCKANGVFGLDENKTASNSSLGQTQEQPVAKKLWCALCEKDGHSSMDCPEGF
ncbi:hypothetical protein BZA70DRAFT_266409 [Myxozyma melibiosi]|uniref:CAP-Gly domain-containing protein n=1 Tax=Myxozyma melibiosi TaxID=54550 RepID=A0ABR1F8B6_9ASCO